MNHKVSKQLLFDYFAGKTTPLQEMRIDHWFRYSPKNPELFFLWLEEWGLENARHEFDAGPNFERLKERIRIYAQGRSVRPLSASRRMRGLAGSWQKVAAVLILMILASTAYFLVDVYSGHSNYHTDYGEMRVISLPDGSTVKLNANSSLKVADNMEGGGLREVWLDGEAFFSVVHTADDRGFVVHNGAVRVEVLGTEFDVKGRHDKTRVVLNSGKVRLNLDGGPPSGEVVMLPGEMVEYKGRTQGFVRKRVDTRVHTSWRNGELIFEQTPLREVAKMLEENYGLKVQIADTGLKDQKFTATLPAGNVEVLLKAIGKSFGLEMEQSEDQVTFRRGR